MMYLLIDIGNSRVKFALATKEKREEKFFITTGLLIEEPLDLLLLEIIERRGYAISDVGVALVSSVVPEYNATITMACTRLGMKVFFVTKDVALPLKTAFDIPPMLGVDRLLMAYGATIQNPNSPSIIVSFGTATTFNCVENNTFIGGLLFAGVMQSLQGLVSHASQIRHQHFELTAKKGTEPLQIAQNTKDSIERGFTEGFASMVEGILQKLQYHFAVKPHYISAGGMSSVISSYTNYFDTVQEDLVLDALWYLMRDGVV